MTFPRAVDFVLSHEGGYSHDPFDPGGETKYGISKRAYPKLEIRTLTQAEAIEIYREDFWNKCKCNELPGPLAMIVFDSAVNQGPATAIKLLQKSLSVKADGVVGPETIAAAHRAPLKPTVAELVARRGYQYALHPSVARFGLGWFRRLSACHQLAIEPM